MTEETSAHPEETSPPHSDEPIANHAPESSTSPAEVEAESGIGLGAGIVIGASVGVLLALAAAMWIGFQGPAVTGGSSNPGDSALTNTQPGQPTPERPATGTDILPPDRTGGSTLILQNVGDLDAVVVLADETTYVRAVYVRSDERVTIPDVAAGTYEILMMLGRNWNAGGFTQAATYQRLDQPIAFEERDVGSTTEYTQLTVSIEPMTPGLMGVGAVAPFQLTAP